MPMLPGPARMERIRTACLETFDRGKPCSAFDLVQRLMDLPELPMHCPYHHFLMPAALLTAANLSSGGSRETLERQLRTAGERAGSVPGGYCGQFGACGAAVGAGIFASVWQGTDPHSKSGWAACNEMTARCLASIAAVEGPRCCKRVTYLTLGAAVPAAAQLLGVDLGPVPAIRCHHFSRSRDCRGTACPFFPAKEQTEKP